jgi:hypothetical protein
VEELPGTSEDSVGSSKRFLVVVLVVLSAMTVPSALSLNVTQVGADSTRTTVTGQLEIAYPMDHPARYSLVDSLGSILLIPAPGVEGDLY